MTGRRIDRGALFREVRLEERVPAGHLLRGVDAILDLPFVRAPMAPHHARGGRPSLDPGPMVRMPLVGHLHGIRFGRRPCEEVDPTLAHRRLGPVGH